MGIVSYTYVCCVTYLEYSCGESSNDSMKNLNTYKLSSCDFANCLPRKQIMDHMISPLWAGMPRISGPAFTVSCPPGDNLMMHVAIHEAPKGSIIVINAGSCEYAVAGGNVCKVAKKRGILGFIIDGVIRDIAEIRDIKFPVYTKGLCPKPGAKKVYQELNLPITCGDVHIIPNDIIVADEDGIVVIPYDEKEQVLSSAKEKASIEKNQSLEAWEADHKKKIKQLCEKAKSQGSS